MSLLRWIPIGVVALAVLALALTGHPVDAVWPREAVGPWRAFRPVVALLAAVLLIGVTSRLALYREGRENLLGRAARASVVLVGVMTLTAPIALLLVHRTGPPETPDQVVTRSPTPTPDISTGPASPSSLPPETGHSQGSVLIIEIIVLALLLMVTVALVIMVMRNFQVRGYRFGDQAEALPYGTLEDAEDLADAVEAATAALALGEAREAVIACYAAMENHMRVVGLERQAAESPEELLIRAVRAGLVRGSGARRLTDLFREARFSAHTIDETRRTAARAALTEIARDLDESVAERKAVAAEAARVAAGRAAEAAQAAAEGREIREPRTSESKRGTHR